MEVRLMAKLYHAFKSGTITDAPLTLGATTINSAGFSALPTISTDSMYLVLDPAGTAGTPEIVTVTTHTAAATSVTATRGQQASLGGSAARQHYVGTSWVAAFTPQDLVDIIAALPSGLMTTKGDIITRNTTVPSRLAVGTNDQVLTADSAQALGVKWASARPRHGVQLRRSTNWTHPGATGTWSPLRWDIEDLDTNSYFPASGTTLTIPTAGIYTLSFSVAGADNSFDLGIYRLSSALLVATSGTGSTPRSVATTAFLLAGETVQFVAYIPGPYLTIYSSSVVGGLTQLTQASIHRISD